jgi:uncharacterized SAM-binding protein YcdF (DUF218 family)
MFFTIGKLLWAVGRPSTFLMLLGWAGFVLLLFGYRRLALPLLGVGLGGLFLVLALPLSAWLLRPLEDHFPRPAAPDRVDGIVALGGAVLPDMTAARGLPALNAEAERMTEFVALARRHPEARLAFTGGRGTLVEGRLSEADVAHRLFDALGLDGRPITYEGHSRDTGENATDLRDLLHPAPDQTWVLITSAWHMPRAVAAFRHAGWHVLPWPVAYKTGTPLIDEYQKSLPTRLAELDLAVHEWAGLLAYRLLGRSDTILPAP